MRCGWIDIFTRRFPSHSLGLLNIRLTSFYWIPKEINEGFLKSFHFCISVNHYMSGYPILLKIAFNFSILMNLLNRMNKVCMRSLSVPFFYHVLCAFWIQEFYSFKNVVMVFLSTELIERFIYYLLDIIQYHWFIHISYSKKFFCVFWTFSFHLNK